jgi:hypothetical protein
VGSAIPASIINAGGSLTAAKARTTRALTKSAATASQYPSVVMADNPIAFYRLADTTSVLTDSSSNNLNGTYGANVTHGGPAIDGTYDASTTFPGGAENTANFATVPNGPLLQPNTLSIEAWISEAAASTRYYLPFVEYGRDLNGAPYELHVTPLNTVEMRLCTSGGIITAQSSTNLVPGTPYHIVGTFDGAIARIYVNGTLQASSSSHPGVTLNYSGTWGLGVGGGEGSKYPSFAGAESDVSLYNYALSGTQVLNHYESGVLTPPLTETPLQADAFVSTIGVNVHLSDTSSLYINQYQQFKTLLLSAGIRHIRDAMPELTTSIVTTHLNDLAASGVHSILSTSTDMTDAYLEQYPSLVPTSFEGYEGPNEPDDQGVPNWAAPTQAFMQRLSTDVSQTPSVAAYPIIAPALVMGNTTDATALGNISSLVTYGNVHDYFAGYNPGTTGWGSLGVANAYYGSLANTLGTAAIESGSRPVMATETGYGVMPPSSSGNVSSAVLAKYVPRTLLMHYKAGIVRTYDYEFFDQNDSGAKFTNYGLVDLNCNPKPSYNALKSLIGALSDPGPAFSPPAQTYTIAGDVTNVQHLMMMKRNGTYYLALWIETPSWNPTSYTPITVAPQTISIHAAAPLTSVSASTLNDSGTFVSTPTTLDPTNTIVTINVTDSVTLLQMN